MGNFRSERDVGVGMQAAQPRSIMRTLSGLSVWGNPCVLTSGRDALVSETTALRQRQALLDLAELHAGTDSPRSHEWAPEGWARLRIVLFDPEGNSSEEGSSSGNDGSENTDEEMWDSDQPIVTNADLFSDDGDDSDGSTGSDGAAHHHLNLIDDMVAAVDDAATQNMTSRVQANSSASASEHSFAVNADPSGFSPVRSETSPEVGSDSDSDHTNDDEHVAHAQAATVVEHWTKKRKARVVVESDEESDSD